MRVLQVARFGSIKGGAETYVASLSTGLREAGHEVALVYGADPDSERPEVRAGFEVPGLVEPGAMPRGDNAGKLREAIEAFGPEIVHVHTPDVTWVAPVAARYAPALLGVHDFRLNCPAGTKYWTARKAQCTVRPGVWCLGYNVTHHCGSLRANATLKPYTMWQAARSAADALHLQVFSRFVRDRIAETRFDGSRIAVTPYPVPPPALPAPPRVPADPRPVIFASGRLNKEKGFHQLIGSLEHVKTRAHLVIGGDGHERAALERRAASMGGGHRITFTGWLSAEAAAGWRERAALVAVPSMWPEPFGIVGLEAMAAGRAVVAFESGGIPEWLDHGQTGILVRPGDVRGLGNAIDELLDDDVKRVRMEDTARERVEERFGLAGHVERVVALYRDVRRDQGYK